MPKVVFNTYTSAVFSKCAFDTNSVNDVDDMIRIRLDGVSREYRVKASYNLANREWVNLTDLQKLLYENSNNYIISIAGDTLTIISIDYDTGKDFSSTAIIVDPSGDWSLVLTTATVPTTDVTFVNPASISDDATPTTMAGYTWHAVTQETAGTEDTELWRLRLERELARRGKPAEFLSGPLEICGETEDTFGTLTGLLPSGETNYAPVTLTGNTYLGEWNIEMKKIHDETVTFVGEEVLE